MWVLISEPLKSLCWFTLLGGYPLEPGSPRNRKKGQERNDTFGIYPQKKGAKSENPGMYLLFSPFFSARVPTFWENPPFGQPRKLN